MTDILTVTLNPALDIATSVAKLAPTHKLRCAPAQRFPGGGGINVARVLHRLGSDCLALALAGGAMGQQLHDLIEHEGVPLHFLPIDGETRESFSVLETSSGQEFRFVLPGPLVQAHEWQACLSLIGALPDAPRYLVLSGSLPPGVPGNAYAQLALAGKQRGMQVVLDSSGTALAAGLRQGVHLVKPSLRELCGLAGRALDTEAQWQEAAMQIVQSGGAQMVALSLGAQGAMLATAQGLWRADALALPVLSATGAGDSFLAGLLWSLAEGQAPEQALRYGVAAGSASLQSEGTALCRRDDVLRLAPAVALRRGAT